MLTTIAIVLLGIWIFYNGWKFYRHMDWKESPEPSPDFQQMHKRQAELLRLQQLLRQAHEEGKLSKDFIEELNRYCDREMEGMASMETAWKNRRAASSHQL